MCTASQTVNMVDFFGGSGSIFVYIYIYHGLHVTKLLDKTHRLIITGTDHPFRLGELVFGRHGAKDFRCHRYVLAKESALSGGWPLLTKDELLGHHGGNRIPGRLLHTGPHGGPCRMNEKSNHIGSLESPCSSENSHGQWT